MAIAKAFKKTEDGKSLPDKLPRVKREKFSKDTYVSKKQQRSTRKENVKRGQKILMEVNPTLKRRKAKRIAQHAQSAKSPYQHAASTSVTDASAKRSIGMKYIDTSKNKKQPKSSGKEAAAEAAAAKWESRTKARDLGLNKKLKRK